MEDTTEIYGPFDGHDSTSSGHEADTETIDNTGSVFNSRPAYDWAKEAMMRPDPKPLWKELWYEGEIACLFADTNVGKSILAVQIAEAISSRARVLYFDFEMSDKQFQMRYTDPYHGDLYHFNKAFIRSEYRQDVRAIGDIEAVGNSIVDAAIRAKANIIIIDNITWLCNRSEDGDAAGRLMQKLVEMKRINNLSILVLAHTPKRNTAAPLNQNSLAGSKKLANFFDSIFAIGLDKNNKPGGRYIKQIKTRTGEMVYGETHVIVCTLRKDGCFLHFAETGYAHERELLDEPTADDIARSNAREEVLRRLNGGGSVRGIAKEMGLSPKTVTKYRRESKSDSLL